MRIAMTGATGFTGRRVAARLAAAGHGLTCLVRPTSDRNALPPAVQAVSGDLGDAASLDVLLPGSEALVYVASMGFGHVPTVVEACERHGVPRGVFVSPPGIHTRLPAASKTVRVAAEEAVRASSLDWTLVRPTMIYGAPGDRNMERLLRALARWPLLPVPGDGRSLIQPVQVEDLADAIVAALGSDAAVGHAYDVSGPEPLPFHEAVDQAAAALGRRARRMHVPLAPVVFLLRLLEAVRVPAPIRAEQVLRLAEDKAFEHADAARDLGFAPRSFADGIRNEAELLGLTPEGNA